MKNYLWILTLAVFGLAVPAFAQVKMSSPMDICKDEKQKFCAQHENMAEVMRCLLKNTHELSKDCKDDLERMIEMRKQAAMRGGGALSSFGGANAAGPPLPVFSYEGRGFFGDESPELQEHRFNISSPVYKSDKDTVAMSLAAGQTHIGEDLVLDSGFAVPNDLYRVEVGAQYFHQLSEGKNWGLRGSLGYAGEKFSEASSDLSFSLAVSYGFPSESKKGYWVWMLFLSNNSPLGNYVPIPGFIYIHRTATFSGMFGLPLLSMQWTPIDPWMFSFSAFGPSVQAEVARGHIDGLQFFTGYNWSQQSFIPSTRTIEDDRLLIVEQKAFLGVRRVMAEKFLTELQAGRSFERSIRLGEGFLNDDRGALDLTDDWYVSWTIKYAF